MRSDGKVIESTVGQIVSELAQLGIDPTRPVTLLIEPDDWLTRTRFESQRDVGAERLGDDAVDALIKEVRREVNEDMRRETSPAKE